MAVLDKGLKQRIVGALVLLALAVIFLPMLFTREDELRQVRIDAPAMPQTPEMPPVEMETVEVPEPQVLPEEPVPSLDANGQASALPIAPTEQPAAPAQPAQPQAPVQPQAQQQAQAVPPAATPPKADEKRLDPNGLPVSWSIQLASLSSRAGAEKLQQTLRSQGYNAYIRSAEGMNRVFVGPVIERAEADRLRDSLSRQQKLNGFIVRFQPEKG
ncbi:SPOR domain-containing protein [Aquipseudomonas alcaligenes]|uniref:SPOR domain-containing protein n=1 Tax=Pseudomonas sp. PDM13 TaxID=2769255 RepID=UPI0021E08C2D|nr:SPOR domain-containing protein [Pseudomonas sp. PDM13]MCU9951418.1 SPOR domain-containing protein [Pseudomonas sp. PDM13]